MTRARELANLGNSTTNLETLDTLYGDNVLTGRNLIINGAMTVSQRGTSSTGVGASNGVFPCVDRMKVFAGNTAGRATVSQVADVHDGFANALKFECTTADTSIATDEFFGMQYIIEGQDVQQLKKGTSDAESFTFSFYVKGNASATYTAEIRDLDNDRINTQTFAVTTSWNRISLTFIPDTTGAFDDDNAGSLQLSFWLHAGSTYTGGTFASNTWASRVQGNRVSSSGTSFFDSTDRTFFITGVQLEVGETATPFEHRSFGEELALCQRYYEEWGGEDAYQPFGYFEGTGTVGYSVIQFTEKRDGPTVTVSNVAHFQSTRAAVVFSAMSFSQPATTHVFCTISRSSNNWASGEMFSWRANNSTSARIYFNAEL